MAPRHSLITIAGVLGAHLERRPVPKLAGLAQLGVVAKVHTLVDACQAVLMTGGRQPLYDRANDVIIMPPPAFYCLARVITRPRRYAIDMLHELVHWSGHRRRLARPAHQQTGDLIYQREELTAELGSALLMHDIGVSARPILPHARYLNTWLANLPNPTLDLDIALSHANQAAGYIVAVARRNLAS